MVTDAPFQAKESKHTYIHRLQGRRRVGLQQHEGEGELFVSFLCRVHGVPRAPALRAGPDATVVWCAWALFSYRRCECKTLLEVRPGDERGTARVGDLFARARAAETCTVVCLECLTWSPGALRVVSAVLDAGWVVLGSALRLSAGRLLDTCWIVRMQRSLRTRVDCISSL